MRFRSKFSLFWAVCWCAFALFACQSSQEPADAPASSDGPDQEGWNSTITVTSNGRRAAHVQYSHMAKYSKKREVHFDGGLVVDFYNQQGNHTSRLTSERGLLFEETNDVEARDNVVAVSDSGITLRSQSLKWNNRRQKIFTDDFVTITTAEGDTLRGHGFESDQNLENYSIKQPTGMTKKRLVLPRPGRRSNTEIPAPPADSASAPAATKTQG